jgi:hypothetical protein
MLTVTTAATKFNLIDTATARSAIGVTGNKDDKTLASFISRVSDVIARHCKRTFAKETLQETFRLDWHSTDLVLARYPVSAITSVVENSQTLTASDYEADLTRGVITRLYDDRPGFWSHRKITVAYSAGYDLPDDAPPGLQEAAIRLLSSYWHLGDRDPALRSDDVPGVYSASYLDMEHLPHDVRGLLAPFRDFRMV